MPSVHHEINQITHNVRGQPYEFQIVALYGEVFQILQPEQCTRVM